jgi:alanine racemase
MLLGPALACERAEIVAAGFVPLLSSVKEAAAYAAAVPAGKTGEVHLKVDTGMGRVGVWRADALDAVRAVAAMPGLRLTAVATHLPVSDEDSIFTTTQLADWRALVGEFSAAVGHPLACHASNSAGILGFDDGQTLARPGLMLYGVSPLPAMQSSLRAVLTWKTRVTLVRDLGAGRTISYGRTFTTPRPMRVATLAAGYADGYRRSLTGKNAEVLIAGRRCPVLGRVTMDQIMADVTGLDVTEGAEAVLLGRQGAEEISASELAEKAGTIAWELFTGIGPRVRRVAVE